MALNDSFVDDLDILDYLELLHSTTSVARELGISQSSCSRRYRALSQHFDLGFDRVDGRYAASRNGDVLASLRQAAQMRRVRVGQFRFGVGWQLVNLFQADGHSLSYGGPHDGLVAAADGVKPLAYPLQIVEVGAVLGHRDVIEDGQFETNFKQLSRQLRQSPGANQDGLHWLI